MQLALSVILLLALIPCITTLRCYQCNTIENADCGDSEKLAPFEQECRKGNKDCYKTAGANTASVCSCQEDRCNTAPSFNRQQQWMAIFSSIILVAISMVIVR
ncbi:hypothetical protein I4U23_014160 [Adineta vaga]|nr:hypothetical protein I4U23_014160 [Adineta vaga]